jgi:predicted RND superfamily exporter protein
VLDKASTPGHGAPVTVGAKLARRYASWIEHRRWAIIASSLVFAAVAAFGASRLRILADFSYLLPQDVRSVTDLRAIGKRGVQRHVR